MRVLIRGAGDLATGIAYELWKAGHEVLMTEIAIPLAVRREVSFSRAVYEEEAQVEEAKGVLVQNQEEADFEIAKGNIPVIVDEEALILKSYHPDVLVDAIMAKKNLGTTMNDAPMVIGIGPGFCAGKDCHYVIETQRGAALGKVICEGCALPNTGIPGEVGGFTRERLLNASADGMMEPLAKIGEIVQKGQIVARTGGAPVYASMTGIVRGMLQEGVVVSKGLKIGDVDARLVIKNCYTISDKARKIGQGVLEALTMK
ncbi:MAG: selenium-dependent molybdenum cofactor biosynthesis protein YqeB [Bariatricus sp.]|nr:selenium-dependent molybdenum cofactor biosynthesis protein YqeB [Bariatricus sp.]